MMRSAMRFIAVNDSVSMKFGRSFISSKVGTVAHPSQSRMTRSVPSAIQRRWQSGQRLAVSWPSDARRITLPLPSHSGLSQVRGSSGRQWVAGSSIMAWSRAKALGIASERGLKWKFAAGDVGIDILLGYGVDEFFSGFGLAEFFFLGLAGVYEQAACGVFPAERILRLVEQDLLGVPAGFFFRLDGGQARSEEHTSELQ